MTNTSFADEEVCDRLLTAVKKGVKQIMEEAVTKKFIHEESSSIVSLCGAVECCLQHGLKKRALGLFKNSTTTALLHKISKQCEPAASVVRVLSEVECNQENARKNLENGKNGSTKHLSPPHSKYLWIRVALFEKQLHRIIDYLVQHASKYYEKESLISDPCNGPVLSALLVGPCALDYTKMKTGDHYWTDPPADELVQRHRIHSSGAHMRPDSPKRPGLQVTSAGGRRHTSSSSEERERVTPMSAKQYVESLHQNSKTQLLYGKNNVIVQPKEDIAPLAGYLSLHHGNMDGLSIKWTPNQLMNGCCEEDEQIDRSLYWDYAVTIYLEEIVYLHCHQQHSGGTIVLVGQDGVQRPPIHFPKGGHLLAFLSCLETGLLPHGQLDPPLWSQRGKGKVFPKLKRKPSRLSQLSSSSTTRSQDSVVSGMSITSTSSDDSASFKEDEDEAADYVFRIITSFRPDNLPSEMLDPKAKSSGNLASFPWMHKDTPPRLNGEQSKGKPPMCVMTSGGGGGVNSYAKAQLEKNNTCINKNEHRSVVKQLCDTMKNQILSRAFYGWLSYCRHLKTVRTHLSGLVNSTLVAEDSPHDASAGLTVEQWGKLCQHGVVTDSQEIYRLVYYGGIAHEIRPQVWPYLLGHYTFGSTPEERQKLDGDVKCKYELTMSEWLAVEAIVKQKDKEVLQANLVKFSQESTDGHIPLVRKDSSLSNDVFESIDSEDFSHPETVPEETSSQLVTPTTEEEQRLPSLALGEIKPQQVSSIKSSSVDNKGTLSPDEGIGSSVGTSIGHGSSISDSKRSDSYDIEPAVTSSQRTSHRTSGSLSDELNHDSQKNIIVTQATIDTNCDITKRVESPIPQAVNQVLSTSSADGEASPASKASNGSVYSTELLESVALNLHRIDKDVQRCDRNYFYFTHSNLEKLRNVMCTYVWENLEIGYVQGMCDLLAPLLVIMDDESRAYSLFCHLMKRMTMNFPHGGAMDQHFANMRSLIQILDPETFEHMHQNGDYTHFYFCYRWFLLDFKRELVYDDVFSVWETIWSAKHVSSPHFMLFIALALVQYYREIIIDNNMDFTDIIKFFNEMAERHSLKQVLRISRDLVYKLQNLIENK